MEIVALNCAAGMLVFNKENEIEKAYIKVKNHILSKKTKDYLQNLIKWIF